MRVFQQPGWNRVECAWLARGSQDDPAQLLLRYQNETVQLSCTKQFVYRQVGGWCSLVQTVADTFDLMFDEGGKLIGKCFIRVHRWQTPLPLWQEASDKTECVCGGGHFQTVLVVARLGVFDEINHYLTLLSPATVFPAFCDAVSPHESRRCPRVCQTVSWSCGWWRS